MSTAGAHNAPLRLFWWKAVPNFGDALSQIVTAHVSGRVVSHSGPAKAELYAVGSVLQIARRNFTEATAALRPWIWGSGLLHSVPKDFLRNVNIALLRGPVTAALLGVDSKGRYGDPGLLIADALGQRPERTGKIGLVPHHSQVDDPQIKQLAAQHPELQLIDVRGDATAVCQQIAACAHVFASSLHGLITADAYGVASTWADPGAESHLKYHDYAAAIGRPMIAPVAWEDIPGHLNSLRDTDALPYADGIAAAQSALRETFPAPLRAIPDAGAA